jgi:nicotinamide riboside kinase
MKARRICLYAGGGAGKSTTAAWLFSELKRSGYSIELVVEYVKALAWQDRRPQSFDQCYLFGKQLHYEDRILRSNCQLIVTDSPVLLSSVYARLFAENTEIAGPLETLALIFEKQFPSINIFLERGDKPYKLDGRWGDIEGAKMVDAEIRATLDGLNFQYYVSNWKRPDEILAYIKSKLDEQN